MQWHTLAQARMNRFNDWDLNDLWRLMSEARARVHPLTGDFVTEWYSCPFNRLEGRHNRAGGSEADYLAREAVERAACSHRQQHRAGAMGGRLQPRANGFWWSAARTLLGDIASATGRSGHA